MPGMPFALDGYYNFTENGNTATAFTALFQSLGSQGANCIPSVPFNAGSGYITAIAPFIDQFGTGLMVRVNLGDLQHVQAWVSNMGWNAANVDLVIDVGGVAEHDPIAFGAYVTHAIQGNLTPTNWRSVTLASYAAPRDHGALSYGRNVVPRRDYQLWDLVRSSVSSQLDYADSGHIHPSLEDAPGVAMASATVSARYTVLADWIIYKGVSTSGQNGIPMRTQYQSHARHLVTEAQFNNIQGCWGDDQIRHYATTPGGTGNRGNWAALALNRHISVVADQLP
jgi:hypothetical protein